MVSDDSDSGEHKRKRKQLSSCDSCRLRRVRCIRDSPTEICQSCREKGITCTSDYISKRPKIVRTGKRIKEAREKFGVDEKPDATSSIFMNLRPNDILAHYTSPNNSKPSTPQDIPSMPKSPESHDSIVAAFFTDGNLAKTLGKHLIDSYYEGWHYQHPAIDWEPFYRDCSAAGFDSAAMTTPEGEVLCLAVQALGARVSDHPLIAGEGCPPRTNLPRGADLSRYGNYREAFCKSLQERALRLFDIRGIMRRVSATSIIVLLVLNALLEFSKPEEKDPPRLMMVIALEQMRIIAERRKDYSATDLQEVLGGRLFWGMFVRESLQSAGNGRQLLISDDDIKIFSPQILEIDRTPLPASGTSDPNTFVAIAALHLFGKLAMISRSICQNISGPVARQTSDWSFNVYENLWNSIDSHGRFCAQIEESIMSFFGGHAPTFQVWIRGLYCARTNMILLMDDILKERVEQISLFQPHSLNLPAIRDLAARSRERSFTALLDLCEMLQGSEAQSQGIAFGGVLLLTVGQCIKRLFEEPAREEENGRQNWPLTAKINCIENLLGHLGLTAFAWSAASADIPGFKADLAALKARTKRVSQPAQLMSGFEQQHPTFSTSTGPVLSQSPLSDTPSSVLNPSALNGMLDPFDSFMIPTLYPATHNADLFDWSIFASPSQHTQPMSYTPAIDNMYSNGM